MYQCRLYVLMCRLLIGTVLERSHWYTNIVGKLRVILLSLTKLFIFIVLRLQSWFVNKTLNLVFRLIQFGKTVPLYSTFVSIFTRSLFFRLKNISDTIFRNNYFIYELLQWIIVAVYCSLPSVRCGRCHNLNTSDVGVNLTPSVWGITSLASKFIRYPKLCRFHPRAPPDKAKFD